MQVKFIYIVYIIPYSSTMYITDLFLRKSRGNAWDILLVLTDPEVESKNLNRSLRIVDFPA